MELIVAKVVLAIVIFNAVCLGLDLALGKVKDLTKSDLDDKAYAIAHSAASISQKLLDVIRGIQKPAAPAVAADAQAEQKA
jgi:hypothetical protein